MLHYYRKKYGKELAAFWVGAVITALTFFIIQNEPEKTYAQASSDCIFIDSNHYYDPSVRMYAYIIDDISGNVVYSNVSDGMITNGPVRLDYKLTDNIELLQNGSQVQIDEIGTITEPGSYIVRTCGNDVTNELFKFSIPDIYTSMTAYSLPEGCRFTNVTCNDEVIVTDAEKLLFSGDGTYHVEYVDAYSDLSFMFDTTIDMEPPVLTLDGVTDGVAKGNVVMICDDPEASFYIEQDGRPYDVPQNLVLDEAAAYYVRVTDRAGNSSEYTFSITVYVDSLTIVFIVLVILIILILVVILFTERRKLRIR